MGLPKIVYNPNLAFTGSADVTGAGAGDTVTVHFTSVDTLIDETIVATLSGGETAAALAALLNTQVAGNVNLNGKVSFAASGARLTVSGSYSGGFTFTAAHTGSVVSGLEPGGGFGQASVLLFARGPRNFQAFYSSRKNDNLSTSGLRERVLEANDILITFEMPALRIDDDLPAWAGFMYWALGGLQFDFYPNSDINEHYHCVSDDDNFTPQRVGLRVYSAAFQLRVVPDSIAPASPAQVLQRINGIGP